MATSGSIYGSTNNPYVSCRLDWSQTPDVAANTSSVSVNVYWWRNNSGYETYGTIDSSVTLDGTTIGDSRSIDMYGASESGASLGFSGTFTVAHNSDGTKSVSVSASGGISGTSFTSTSLSGTITLETIPRATTPTLSTYAVTMGQAITITFPRASSSFTHNLTYSFGSASGTITTGAGASCTWAPEKWLAAQIPNSVYGSCTLTCTTYSGSTAVGSKTVVCSLYVSPDSLPAVSTGWVSVTPGSANSAANGWGIYVQGYSYGTVSFNTSKVAAQYGASITSYKIACNGATVSASPYRTPVFSSAGTNTITCTVTDSRGLSYSGPMTVDVQPYAPPYIGKPTFYRCNGDSNMTKSDTGTFLYLLVSDTFSSCGGKNSAAITATLKDTAGTTRGTAAVASGTGAKFFADPANSGSGLLDATKTYTVTLSASDALSTGTAVTITIPTADVTFNLKEGGKGAAFGKYAETDGVLEIDPDWILKYKGSELLNLIYPVGSIYMSVNSADPRTLFGGTWTQIKGRFLLATGANEANSSNWCGTLGAGSFNCPAGETGGEVNHVLTLGQMPYHNHPLNGHTWSWGNTSLTNEVYAQNAVAAAGASPSNNLDTSQGYWDKTAYAGGNESHNNMPPYLSVYMWKRTA